MRASDEKLFHVTEQDLSSPVRSLYVHVPFCSHKCEYCAFYSELLQPDRIKRYVDALCVELGQIHQRLQPRTIFFGGGTPSILTLAQWEQICSTIHSFGWNEIKEWTVECNPATVSIEKAKLLRDAGVNRISMGVQSLDSNLLDRLGRIHSRDQVFRSYEILRKAGFGNINLDLMFAIPSQSIGMWKATLDEIFAMESDHVSCYEVIYEEDTALFHQLQAGEFDVDEDLADEMYQLLVKRADDAGFEQYEIANFAKRQKEDIHAAYPNRAALHNINYWEGGDYYGAGPAATEFIGNTRRKHWSNTQLYCDQVEKGLRGMESEERLSHEAKWGEAAAFALRMNTGIVFSRFHEQFGFNPLEKWRTEMETIQQQGWGVLSNNSFRLTDKGLRFADNAGSEFVYING
ncbi:MAG: radical SAM family heme chaperone HemW [Verrucomicrobia bacterium]|nr:radical SAM family heme chaperone HemW [Verrucomicrobiota bacterium]